MTARCLILVYLQQVGQEDYSVIITFIQVKQLFFDIGPFGLDGNECPAFCPLTVSNCPENHMICPGGPDANGCPMPATCFSMTGDFFLLSDNNSQNVDLMGAKCFELIMCY